jgi:hypothetical protein
MSLKTQLWIAVAILMLLSLLVSVGVSTVSAHNYLSQQLHLKNVDNAASLALSLTQLPKDEATVELALAAQFDTGHYRLIRLVNPRGEVMQGTQQLRRPRRRTAVVRPDDGFRHRARRCPHLPGLVPVRRPHRGKPDQLRL